MLKHTKKVRRITYIIGFTSIGLGLITIITVLTILQIRKNKVIEAPLSCQELIEQIIQPGELRTTIEKVSSTDICEKFITLKDPIGGINTFCLCPGSVIPDLFFQPGDTVIFRPDSPKMTISSGQSLEMINFDYPCCE